LVQFSGIVVTGGELTPIPFSTVMIKDSYRGTTSDYYGYFSFVAQKRDTIVFNCIGYKPSSYIIPDTLTKSRYSLIQILNPDTYELPEAVVYPWPSKEQFKEAFINLDIPDDDLERAYKNLARAELRARFENMPMDGSMNFKNQMQQYQSKLYYAGQYPPISLLNPIAWARFIRAWKNGDFKRKKK